MSDQAATGTGPRREAAARDATSPGGADLDPRFEALLQYLKESRGFDLTGYKRTSLMRRVNRRLQASGIVGYDDYRDHLEAHPDEFTALFDAILINVTGFFRDPEAWAHLRAEILPLVLAGKAEDDPVRIWSAGCATGEEAYSLAIALAEELGVERFRQRVKIYATDVDEEALAEARRATFAERDLHGVPAELVDTYFEVSGGRRTFVEELRRSVVFGRNDLVQDAPISHIDLLACRNTLMYFNAGTQGDVVRRLHFALEDTGVLFLGKAEMLLDHASIFAPLDLTRRFFRKVAAPAGRDRAPLAGTAPAGPARSDGDRLARLRHEAMNAGPVAQVVLDAEGRTLVVNRRAERLFGLTAREIGRPFDDLELSYRPAELRSPIEQAAVERRPVRVRDVEWSRGGSTLWLDIQIVPLLDRDGSLLGTSVCFGDVTRYHELRGVLEYAHRRLESAYEELQSTNEELETTNEVLRSTVEELATTNEELRSTNAELETMNEELQSSNEELRERPAQGCGLDGFMASVLTAMRAGVAVVDRDLRVQAWNARAEELWGVRREETVDRHLLDLDVGLPVERLEPLVRQVLALDGQGPATTELDAVDRRGRSVRVAVAVGPLRQAAQDTTCALIVMSAGD